MLDLGGVRVEFPFEPYDCQKQYMKQVINSLVNRQNALLESPTGPSLSLFVLFGLLSLLFTLACTQEREKLFVSCALL